MPTIREMRCELACLKNVDGSCNFSQGYTAVMASCSGPGDVHAARADEQKMILEVSFRAAAGDNKFHRLNNIITSTIANVINKELFPNTTLVVTIHGLQDDGSMGAAAINSTCFALLDNGIPFRTLFCGVNVVKVNGELIVDPTAKNEANSEANMMFVLEYDPKEDPKIAAIDITGAHQYEEVDKASQLAIQAAINIFAFIRASVTKKLSVDLEHTVS